MSCLSLEDSCLQARGAKPLRKPGSEPAVGHPQPDGLMPPGWNDGQLRVGTPSWLFVGWATPIKSLNLSEPQSPHLKDGV